MISTWTKREAASGIVFVVLVVVGTFLAGEPPFPDDPPEEISAFFIDNRTTILTQAFLGGLALIPFLWFAGVLRSVLRRFGEDAERLASVSFGAAIATGALQLTGTMIQAALAFDAGREERRYVGDAATVTALFDIGFLVIYMVGFAVSVFVGAAALAMLRTRALPAWLGWLGIAAVVANLLVQFLLFVDPDDFGDIAIVGLLAFLLFLVWLLATSIMLMRLDDRDEAAAAATS